MQGETLLSVGHGAMSGAFVLCVVAAFVAYGWSEQLDIRWQLLAHLLLIVLPVFLKLGYIMRLTALRQLGRALN